MVQLVRVVDSSNNEYCLEVVTPTSDRRLVNERHFTADGRAHGTWADDGQARSKGALGAHAHDPAPARARGSARSLSPSWVQVYRELTEWAVLLKLATELHYGTDTVIVADGTLRSKVFQKRTVREIPRNLAEAIQEHEREHRRRIYIAGVVKHSKVLQRIASRWRSRAYFVLTSLRTWKCPASWKMKSYVWSEYARGDNEAELAKRTSSWAAKCSS